MLVTPQVFLDNANIGFFLYGSIAMMREFLEIASVRRLLDEM
jgi:hypothetical protein